MSYIMNNFNFFQFSNRASYVEQGQYIYLVSGTAADSSGKYPIERLQIKDDRIIESEIVGHHEAQKSHPILFTISSDFCV